MKFVIVPSLFIVTQLAVILAAEEGEEGEEGGVRSRRSVVAQLQYLLDEERSLRQRLDARVQRLRSEANRLNNTIPTSPCNCQPPTRPTTAQVAFTGQLHAYMTSLATTTVLNFTDNMINIGGSYNTSSARFVAPVSGIYGFSLTMYMNPTYWTNLQLVKNGTAILRVKTGHRGDSRYNRQVNMATNYGLYHVTAGEEVWPQYVTSSGTRLWADGVTSFSAVLLHEL